MRNRVNILPYVAGVAYATIFGFSFLATKNALDHIDPFHFLGLRYMLATLALTVLILTRIVKVNFKGKNIRLAIYLGILEPFLYMICETFSIKMISSSQVGMMIAVIPIFVTIFSAIFLKEYVTPKQLFFIILSVAGVIFIVMMQSGFSGDGNIWGYVVAMGAVIAAAGYTVYSRKLSTQFTPFELTYVIVAVAAVNFSIIGFLRYKHVGAYTNYFAPLKDMSILIPLLYLAVFSSVIAFALMNFTLSKITATQTAVFSNLVTVVSIIAGVTFRHEAFEWYHFIGGAMILLGVWGVNRYLKQQISEKSTSLSQ
ncbi:DMT family transporter [Clostridium sp. 'deep sea']|uniref:DMT family transporter n=1 Tax=Clostridium sp. 'deep sea' TaxID=2779445 RepID=UPI0018968F8D|nr:DMT family transporter [Clostridium sp. 'deep sea']QOR36134.1 DMT family transporter [Clostridium sp. 'deep sea']